MQTWSDLQRKKGTQGNLWKVSHPLVWFCRSWVADTFCILWNVPTVQKIWISHYYFLRAGEIVKKKKENRVKETVRCYWPFKKRSFDFSSSLALSGNSTVSERWQTCESESRRDRDSNLLWRCVSDLGEWKGTTKWLSKKHNKTKTSTPTSLCQHPSLHLNQKYLAAFPTRPPVLRGGEWHALTLTGPSLKTCLHAWTGWYRYDWDKQG